MKIAMVVSEFNFDVTSAMEERARRHAAFLGVEVSHVVHVPGVFDMGPAVKKLLRRKDVDAVVIIGTVIKGDTGHDEIVAQAAARAAAELALQFDKPVALGMTGPGMTREHDGHLPSVVTCTCRIKYPNRSTSSSSQVGQ